MYNIARVKMGKKNKILSMGRTRHDSMGVLISWTHSTVTEGYVITNYTIRPIDILPWNKINHIQSKNKLVQHLNLGRHQKHFQLEPKQLAFDQ